MIWQLDFWLLLVLIGVAVVALRARDLLVSVVALGAYSFLMALLFAQLGAVDVAFTEAVLGAGVVGVLLLVALFRMDRRSSD
ncbi:MAG: DUF4040 domain-containing protein [Chloroflexota bacterium]|nr:DUF4040 domain-containing protein [Chloroflexota bacterium]